MDTNENSSCRGFTVRYLKPEVASLVDNVFNEKNALVEYNPGQCLLQPIHESICQQILDAPVREDDVWLLSYPRTGSTWCMEMIWLICNDLDFDGARKVLQLFRAPIIELSTILDDYREKLGPELDNSVDFVNALPSPRFLRSHLPSKLVPTQLHKIKPKIIYTCRNPKDTCVSYYYYLRGFHHLNTSFEQFADLFMRGLLPIGPIFQHYLGYWNKRHEPNVLFLRYEEMKRDMLGALKKIAHFLEKDYTVEQYRLLCNFLSFQNMKENEASNAEVMTGPVVDNKENDNKRNLFIRKGVVGDWKNHMTPELSKKFDAWIEENTKGTGLSFD